MSENDKAFEDALAAIAKLEGKSVHDLKQEMLRDRLSRSQGGGTALAGREPARPPTHDPYSRLPARVRHESPEEAQERWYAEEAMLTDGVHGFAGQTAGGIFGEGTIATEGYDPMAHHRATSRAAQLAQIQAAQAQTEAFQQVGSVLKQLADHVGLRLPGAQPRELPARRRRR
jgi:hypothetical protein